MWLKSKLLWSPLSVPFPITATDSHLLFRGATDAHAVTQWFSQKLTQKQREIIFHLVQFPKSNPLVSPRSSSGGDRMVQTTCDGAHSRTAAALSYNSSRCHRALPVGCNKKALAETCLSKAWQPWAIRPHSSNKHTWHWAKKGLIKTKLTAKPAAPIWNNFNTHVNFKKNQLIHVLCSSFYQHDPTWTFTNALIKDKIKD